MMAHKSRAYDDGLTEQSSTSDGIGINEHKVTRSERLTLSSNSQVLADVRWHGADKNMDYLLVFVQGYDIRQNHRSANEGLE